MKTREKIRLFDRTQTQNGFLDFQILDQPSHEEVAAIESLFNVGLPSSKPDTQHSSQYLDF